MLATMESPLAIGFRYTECSCRTSALRNCLPSSDAAAVSQHVHAGGRSSLHRLGHGSSARFLGRGLSDGSWNNILRRTAVSSRNDLLSSRAHSVPENADARSRYHPFEEIEESAPTENGESPRLSDAEIARTIIEVNNKATLVFTGFIDNDIQENIIWSDLPYLTDEHGDIYFEVSNDEGPLHTLIADDKIVQVVIGIDSAEMLTEIEVSAPSDFDFGLEDVSSEESDTDDDYEMQDEVTILEEEDDDGVFDEMLNDWANLETVNSCHPMYFAKKIAEAVSNTNVDWMDQPSASILVQGHLRPAFVEESTISKRTPSELNKDQSMQRGSAFFKLEILNIQMVSAYGNQTVVKIQDFRKARPDVLAHSVANIISRLRAGGDKIMHALKLLCWRHKGMQVEEAAVIGVDSLGFDLRVCSGTQVQTLRFAFNHQATSEFAAERQLHDLLFPKFHQKEQRQQAHQREG
ncbi:uncharacterized protein At3g49140-like isoform X2 [Ananas comosus]|uniref:Uncharacterized protein At3g49140-like isoform X2 n=1 Tax=Ananas comosus TaxID=4615 RepID=A0A6P5GGF6_ANACO|nr:uncharacterized protein At3g49140-like isoform X2 [Ananas comosus]